MNSRDSKDSRRADDPAARDGFPPFAGMKDEGFTAPDYATLVQEHSLFHTLLNGLPDYIFAKDLDGRFLFANEAMLRVTGLSCEAEMLGKTDHDFSPAELADEYLANDREIVATGRALAQQGGTFCSGAMARPAGS